MKVTFDFDCTLDREAIQDYASELIANGHEIHIVTSRLADDKAPSIYWNLDLYQVSDKLKIKRENIHFMSMEDKSFFFMENDDFIWHLDDDWDVLRDIRKLSVVGISCFGSTNWKAKCDGVLKKALKK